MRKFMLFLIISIFCVVTNAHSSDEAKDSQIVNEFARLHPNSITEEVDIYYSAVNNLSKEWLCTTCSALCFCYYIPINTK